MKKFELPWDLRELICAQWGTDAELAAVPSNEQYQTSLSNLPLLFTSALYFLQNSNVLKEKPKKTHMLPSLNIFWVCLWSYFNQKNPESKGVPHVKNKFRSHEESN